MKRKAEAIALLSVYDDDDEDEEENQGAGGGAQPGLNPAAAGGLDSGAGLRVAAPEAQNSETQSKAVEDSSATATTSVEDELNTSNPVEAAPGEVKQQPGSSTPERLLDDFLPPPPSSKCSDELQDKFAYFLRLLREDGRSYNDELRRSKGYRNPDFLHRAVLHEGLDQIGSCFKKEVFDPCGYDPEDFYDVLIAQQNRELERRAQEMKQNKRMEFMRPMQTAGAWVNPPGATGAPAAPAPAPKPEGRANKKSKWDKVEPDVRAVPGLQNALVLAAQAAAFMNQQQRRKDNP